MTAELALTIPSLLLTAAFCLGAGVACAHYLRVVDAAGMAARAAGRGEDPGPTVAALGSLSGTVAIAESDSFVCATVSATVPVAGIPIPLEARSCASSQGR